MFKPSPIPALPSISTSYRLAAVPYGDEGIKWVVNELIERSGLSQAEVARRLGCAPQTVAQYKSGKRSYTSLQWLGKLAEVCGAKILVEFPTDYLERQK